jgi:hypothetical protein
VGAGLVSIDLVLFLGLAVAEALLAGEDSDLGGAGGDRSCADSRAVNRRDMVFSMRSRRSLTSSKRCAFREASLSRFCRSEYVQFAFQTMQFWHRGFSRPHRTYITTPRQSPGSPVPCVSDSRGTWAGTRTFFSRHRSQAGFRALYFSFYLSASSVFESATTALSEGTCRHLTPEVASSKASSEAPVGILRVLLSLLRARRPNNRTVPWEIRSSGNPTGGPGGSHPGR